MEVAEVAGDLGKPMTSYVVHFSTPVRTADNRLKTKLNSS